jgi:hypothetical protein
MARQVLRKTADAGLRNFFLVDEPQPEELTRRAISELNR